MINFNKENSITFIKKNKIPIIVGILSFLVIIIPFSFFRNKNNDYSKKLLNKNYDYVYTYKELNTGRFLKQIPHLNLNMKQINDDIDAFVLNYLDKDDNIISYNFNRTKNILSLVIRIISFADEKAPINYFKTYNINLNSLKEITDEQLLTLFKIDNNYVQAKIEEQFKDYYYDLVLNGSIDEIKCNLECFIERRGFFGYMQDINYYIDKGKLIVYKPFIINSSTWEYEYFKDSDFSFKL